MLTAKSPLWKLWVLLSRACTVAAQSNDPSDARSLSVALQNINGMSSIISLLPVLTGKTQNVKCIAARTFSGSLAVVGLGAGRVLSKLQLGIMLVSADLYRNLVGELSYPHQEYVNAFSPSLIHIPTGTPERHSSNVIVNHNPTEDYMVEAWFQTQGLPAKVELSQGNNLRVFCGLLVYLLAYAFETFLCVQNAATGAAIPLVVVQAVSGSCWIVAVCILQAARGLRKRFIHLNRLATADYRCFQLVTSGKHVHSSIISTQLSNIRDYNLFDSKYDSRRLKIVGGAMVASGIIDIFATILVVGLNSWAYGWLAWQVLLIMLKVIFSLEPLRRVPIVDVQPMVGDTLDQGPPPPVAASSPQGRKTRLPISVEVSSEFTFVEVTVTQNVVREIATQARWSSRTPGIFIGQPYYLQRPMLPEKQTVSSSESIPKLPPPHVPQVLEKRVPEPEKPADPTMFPLPPSPRVSKCASSASSDSNSTITASPTSPMVITEVPRIIISPESPLVASPASPTSPPGIPPIARSASTRSASTRAPTPPSKSPRRAATMPLRGPPPVSIMTRGGVPNPQPLPSRPRPMPHRSLSQTLVATPQPAQVSELKEKHESPSSVSQGESIRYLALGRDGKLTLSEKEPAKEANQALQREFLACLAEVVKANKVPSAEFLLAVETMREGIRKTMADNWYAFGTTDLTRYLRTSYEDVLWRRFV